MPLPSRPVANTTIDSAWGQAVHDYTFAPAGCDLGGLTRTVSNSTGGLKLGLTIAHDDPGGYLDTVTGNCATIPATGEGLYLIILVVDSVNGTVGDQTRAFIYLNGSIYAHALEDSQGGTHIRITVVSLIALTAGDQVTAYAQRKGSGTDPTCYVPSLKLLRVGAEFGAP
jgi:hypothetical protein